MLSGQKTRSVSRFSTNWNSLKWITQNFLILDAQPCTCSRVQRTGLFFHSRMAPSELYLWKARGFNIQLGAEARKPGDVYHLRCLIYFASIPETWTWPALTEMSVSFSRDVMFTATGVLHGNIKAVMQLRAILSCLFTRWATIKYRVLAGIYLYPHQYHFKLICVLLDIIFASVKNIASNSTLKYIYFSRH